MRVIDAELLRVFRGKQCCEWCGWALRSPAQPHHIFTRGMGGGSRLDVRINLVALGGPWDCDCHGRHHAGHEPLTCDLVALVAAREGLLQDELEREIWRLKRAKGCDDGVGSAGSNDQQNKLSVAQTLPFSRRGDRNCMETNERGWSRF